MNHRKRLNSFPNDSTHNENKSNFYMPLVKDEITEGNWKYFEMNDNKKMHVKRTSACSLSNMNNITLKWICWGKCKHLDK